MLKRVIKAFTNDQCMLLSAALAFYTMLSFAPTVILVLWTTSMLGESTQRNIIAQISSTIGPSAGAVADLVIENTQSRPAIGSTAGLIAIAGILLSATTVFTQLIDAMNIVWNVRQRSDVRFVKSLLRRRVVGFFMLLFAASLLFLAMLASAIFTRLIGEPTDAVWQTILWRVINGGVSLAVFMIAVTAVFKFLPDVIIGWRTVWAGAALTAIFLLIGRYVTAAYFSGAALGSAYGAGGALFVLLIWVYYSWAIIFFGAEFTQIWARERHHSVEPRDRAVAVERKIIPND